MAIKFPSLSDLIVSPTGAGTPSDSRTSLASSAGTRGFLASAMRESPFDSSDRETVSSSPSETDTVIYEYEATEYDLEISGSGFCSANPVIIGTLPMTNFYKSGKESNTGILYEIQNQLKDQTVSLADEIVNSYYVANPSAQSSLVVTRDANLAKYNGLVTSIASISGKKQEILTPPSAPNTSYRDLIRDAFTAGAVAYGVNVASRSTAGTSINDDDIVKYDSEIDSDLNIVTALSNKLIGYPEDFVDTVGDTELSLPDQSNTAKQYDLVRMALSQKINQRTYAAGEDISGQRSPFCYREYTSTTDITSLVESQETLTIRSPLEKIASFLVNKNVPTSEYDSFAFTDVDSAIQSNTIYYGGSLAKDANGFFVPTERKIETLGENNAGHIDITHLYSDDLEDPEDDFSYIKHYPVIGAQFDEITLDEFFKKIPTYLGYEIASSLQSLQAPNSISPDGPSSDVIDTVNDNVTYVINSQNDSSVFLFDTTLKSISSYSGVPVSALTRYSLEDLGDMTTKISEISSEIKSFASSNGHVMGRDITIKIIDIFYKNFIDAIEKTALVNSDLLSYDRNMFPASMLFFAAADHKAAARLFTTMINPSSNDMIRTLGKGNSVPFDDVDDKALKFWQGLGIGSGGFMGNGTKGRYTLGVGTQVEYEFISDFSSTHGASSVAAHIFESDDSILKVISKCLSDLSDVFPTLITQTSLNLNYKIMYCAYLMFLNVLRCAKVKISSVMTVDTEGDDAGLSPQGTISYNIEDFAFILDCLNNAINVSSVEDLPGGPTAIVTSTEGGSSTTADVTTVYYEEYTNADLDDSTKQNGSEIFSIIRSPVKYALQVSEDIGSLLAYQAQVLDNQSSLASAFLEIYSTVANDLYEGDTNKAITVINRYASLESITELLYRSNRFQTYVSGTNISSISNRSSNYRSIISAAYKDLIPKKDNLKICIVGFPYGHFERLRSGLDEPSYYFGLSAYADNVSDFADDSTKVDWPFTYISESTSRRPDLKGPYCVLVPDIVDDYNTAEVVSSVSDDNISYYYLSDDRKSLSIRTRSSAPNTNFLKVDFPCNIVQAALQSYVEDIYGLYPRFSTFKSPSEFTEYPESSFADEALTYAGIKSETTEEALIYSRIKSTIMMHRDFITTWMIDDIERSPLFDKITYLIVDTENTDSIITEFFVGAEV